MKKVAGIKLTKALTLIFILLLTDSFAQSTFRRKLGMIAGRLNMNALCETPQKDIAFCSEYSYISKISENGNNISSNMYTIASPFFMRPLCLTPTASDGYASAGRVDTNMQQGLGIEAGLFLVDSAGIFLWGKSYKTTSYSGGFSVREIKATSDGGYMLSGGFTEPIPNSIFYAFDGMVMKTDGQGNILWCYSFDHSVYDEFFSMVELPGGDMIIGGIMRPGFCLVRISPTGNVVYSKVYTYSNGVETCTYKVILSNDGNLLCTGYTADTWSSGFISLVKSDVDGNIIWANNWGYVGTNGLITSPFGSAISETVNGEILVGGNIPYSPQSAMSGIVVRTDVSGNLKSSIVLLDNQTVRSVYERNNAVFAFTEGNNVDMGFYKLNYDFSGSCLTTIQPLDSVGSIQYTVDSTGFMPPVARNLITTVHPFTTVPNVQYNSLKCTVTGLEDINNDQAGNVFPNPVKDKLSLKSVDIATQIQLINLSGKLVGTFTNSATIDENYTMDLSNFPNGIYILKVITAKNAEQYKICISH